jgi:hypothetical protein
MDAESLGRCVTGDGRTPVYPWVAHPYIHCKRSMRPYTLPHVSVLLATHRWRRMHIRP